MNQTAKTEETVSHSLNQYAAEGLSSSAASSSTMKQQHSSVVQIHVKRDLPNDHKNIFAQEPRRIREDPIAYLLHLGLFYQGAGYRGYRDYIGTKILYPEFALEMKEMVLNSPKVQEIINHLANEQAALLAAQKKKKWDEKYIAKQQKAFRKELEIVAKAIADKAFATMNSRRTLRLFTFMVNTLLARLYHQGVHIRESEWVELKRVALLAQEKKQSLIFLPCHKSHMDYLVVSYLMFRLGIQIPHIVAGENLDLPIVKILLKGCGAFYIRREWGKDTLYKGILEEYITTLLNGGYNMECFIEGTRSRLGKVLQPKLGIIKIILDALIERRVEDCHIVPISIGYDKIIETSSYATELLGGQKEKESLWGILTNSSVLQLKWGRVDVSLSRPFSLRDWLDDQIKNRGPIDVTQHQQKAILLKSLGYRVLADINAISIVMPSALVATVILTLRGRGVGRSELIRRVDHLKKVIELKGGRVSEFYDLSTGEVVDRTVTIHKDLIGERKGKDIIEPTFYPINAFELSYYRNQVIHLFVEEAIISAALYTVVKKGGGKPLQRMRYEELLDEVVFLSSLMKLDMIYKPGGAESNTRRTMQWLKENNVIEVSEDGWIGLSDIERRCGRENYDFLCFLIWPFIDAYWLAAVSLFTLAPPNADQKPIWVDSTLFANRTQSLGKTLYYQGDLSYLEACNKETLSNAFLRYQEQGILLKRTHYVGNAKPWSEVAVSPDYTPERQNGILMPRGHLWELVDRIGRFRREGKNRRDNATVSTRVLRLADILGENNAIPTANQKALLKKAASSTNLKAKM